MSTLSLLISETEIATIVQTLAQRIDQDYCGESITAIAILKGSFIFCADLVRALKTPINRIEFISLASYGAQTKSSGQVMITNALAPNLIRGQNILVIEDIIDTGLSLSALWPQLQSQGPRSVKIVTLLDKPSRRQHAISVDYIGRSIADYFVVGYGLDFDQKYRQLPAIYGREP